MTASRLQRFCRTFNTLQRKSVSDLRTGPKEPRSTVLSAEEEAVVVAFRRHALPPLDDCLYRKFKAYPIGYFHIDIAEVRTAQGKLYLLVAIDRTSKFAFVELHEKWRAAPRGTSCAA